MQTENEPAAGFGPLLQPRLVQQLGDLVEYTTPTQVLFDFSFRASGLATGVQSVDMDNLSTGQSMPLVGAMLPAAQQAQFFGQACLLLQPGVYRSTCRVTTEAAALPQSLLAEFTSLASGFTGGAGAAVEVRVDGLGEVFTHISGRGGAVAWATGKARFVLAENERIEGWLVYRDIVTGDVFTGQANSEDGPNEGELSPEAMKIDIKAGSIYKVSFVVKTQAAVAFPARLTVVG